MFRILKKSIIIILALAFVLVSVASCGPVAIAEFPSVTILENDFVSYIEELVDEQIEFYTITVLERDYQKDSQEISYLCQVQYKWINRPDVFTDECEMQYLLGSSEWEFNSLSSEVIQSRVDVKLKMYSLFYDLDYLGDEKYLYCDKDETELSSDVYDFTVQLEDVVYEFPCNFCELAVNGWTISDSSPYSVSDIIEADSYGELEMVNGDNLVTFYVVNTSDSPTYIGQSVVGGLRINSDTGYAVFGEGLDSDSEAAAVTEVFDEPDIDKTTDGVRTLSYYIDSYVNTVFDYYDDYTEIDILNFDSYYNEITPAELFDTYYFGFIVDEVEYVLPSEIYVFLDNGWELPSELDNDTTYPWYESFDMTLSKDGVELNLFVENLSSSDLLIENLVVTKAYLDSQDLDFSLVNVENLVTSTVDSDASQNEFVSFLGQPSSTEEEDGTETLTYSYAEDQYLKAMFSDNVQIELSVYQGDEFHIFDSFLSGFTLDEVWYEFPADASVLENTGWTPYCGWDQTIISEGWARVEFENEEGKTLTLILCNPESEEQSIGDCDIGGVIKGSDDASISIYWDIGVGTEVSTLFEIYGVPDIQETDGDMEIMIYRYSANKFIYLETVDDIIENITVIDLNLDAE